MRRILKNFKLISEPQSIVQKRLFLQKRQRDQLNILAQYTSRHPDSQKLLNCTIRQLEQQSKRGNQQIFSTFTRRNLDQSVRKLNGLADLNISATISKNKDKLATLIPFTVKDHIKVENMIQTAGYSHHTTPATESADIVQILQKENCVVYGQSNVPQGLLGIQSANNVYGLSKNPYKRGFISGGSSGGQGVQVATKASVFGLASDSAGSTRIPAAFCGVYGFKPTSSKRLSAKGRVGLLSKEGPILGELSPSMGFLTRNVDDLKWLCEKTLGKTPNNSPYVHSSWQEKQFQQTLKKKCRIGYLIDNQEIQTAPAIRNAIMQVVQLLKSDGHQVMEFNYPQLHLFKDYCFSIFKVNRFIRGIYNRLGLEDQTKQNQLMMSYTEYGKLGCKIREIMANSPTERKMYKIMGKPQDILSLYSTIQMRNHHEAKFLKQWQKDNIDFLLSPTMPFTAPLAYHTKHLINQLTFCCFQNVMDLPSGNIPVRLVRKEQTKYQDSRFYSMQARPSIERSQGLPVSVQITGSHMQDQACLAFITQIQKLMLANNLGLGKAIQAPQSF